MSSFLYDLGKWCFRHAKIVIAFWLVAVASLGVSAFFFGGSYDDVFSIPGTPSQKAYDQLRSTFPQAASLTSDVLITVPAGDNVNNSALRQVIERGVSSFKNLPVVSGTVSPWDEHIHGLINDDHTAAIAQLRLVPEKSTDLTGAQKDSLIKETHQLKKQLPKGSKVYIGGEAFKDGPPHLSTTEAIGVVAALVVLIITLGSLITAGMPIVTALIGVGITFAIILLINPFTAVNSVTPLLSVMLGLAVGIDYALFIISRHRDQLGAGLDPEQSAAKSVATAGSAVVFAGTTVIIALFGLFTAVVPFLSVMGVFAAIGVTFAVVIALTVLPAFMGIMGKRMSPKPKNRIQKFDSNKNKLAGDKAKKPFKFSWLWVRAVTKMPIVTILVVLVGLGALSFPALNLSMALPDAGQSSKETSYRQTYDEVTKKFGSGFNGPLVVTADIVSSHDPLGVLKGLKDDIENIPGVKSVPVAVPNQNADTGFIKIIPTTSSNDPATTELVKRLIDRHNQWEQKYHVNTAVTGITAIKLDVSHQLAGALLPFGLFVGGLSLILLAIIFRSVVVPIKATIGYGLSVGAAFGATHLVFNLGWGRQLIRLEDAGPVISFMPIVVMGILFGLAMDYEVFLVSRVREEFVHGASPQKAIEKGFTHSGKVVAAAAIIMLFVFVFFVPEGKGPIKQIAFALTIGVGVDAFIVRMTLVPAVLAMLGAKAWWMPAWLDRNLPHFDVEGASITRQANLEKWPTAKHTEAFHIENLNINKFFAPISAHLDPGKVASIIGGSNQITSFCLAISGRMTFDGGLARVSGQLLPERAKRVRRHVPWCEGASNDLNYDIAQLNLKHIRLVVINNADMVVREENRKALEKLCNRARQGAKFAVLLSAQRPQRLNWLSPEPLGELTAIIGNSKNLTDLYSDTNPLNSIKKSFKQLPSGVMQDNSLGAN